MKNFVFSLSFFAKIKPNVISVFSLRKEKKAKYQSVAKFIYASNVFLFSLSVLFFLSTLMWKSKFHFYTHDFHLCIMLLYIERTFFLQNTHITCRSISFSWIFILIINIGFFSFLWIFVRLRLFFFFFVRFFSP